MSLATVGCFNASIQMKQNDPLYGGYGGKTPKTLGMNHNGTIFTAPCHSPEFRIVLDLTYAGLGGC
jgi:hypothetical protein